MSYLLIIHLSLSCTW